MENYFRHGSRPNAGRKRFVKTCQIDEAKMVRPHRENVNGKNSKTSTPRTYYRSKKEGDAQKG